MNPHKQVTILEIAVRADLGKATVSLALRDDPRIRETTRARVKKLAKEMGYRPNPIISQVMSQLRSDRASTFRGTVALINESNQKGILETNSTFRSLAGGFREKSEALGFKVNDFWLGDPVLEQPKRLAEIFYARRIEGVALVAMPERSFLPECFQPIISRSVFVGLGVQLLNPGIHCCANNQFTTSGSAVRKLINAGKKRIGLVISQQIDRLLDGRFSLGFRHALEEIGISPEVASRQIHFFDPTDRMGFQMWSEKMKPDGLITTHTEIADWLRKQPGEARNVALAHLDWDSSMTGWAGMNQNNRSVGSSGADVLMAHLMRRELDLPPFAKTLLVESSWQDGASMRPAEFLR